MDKLEIDFDNNVIFINDQSIELSSISLINLILDLKYYHANIATIQDMKLTYNSHTGDGLCYQILRGKFTVYIFNLTNRQSQFIDITKQLAKTIVDQYDQYCGERKNQRH